MNRRPQDRADGAETDVHAVAGRVADGPEGGEERQARERALRYLSARDRSSAEVRSRLRRYGYSDALIEATVVWLAGLGYVDDHRFAAAFVSSRRKKGWGAARIGSELRAKGIAEDVVRAALSTVAADPTGEAPLELRLAQLVARRFGGLMRADPPTGRRKAIGFLERRGHDWETIQAVLRRVTTESSPEDRVTTEESSPEEDDE
ncbi:MAG: recombination regulator RecX [Thermoleophilia bacterium]